jgi:hypothetical protein
MEGNAYYLERLEKNARTGYLFGRFPIPSGIPFIFTASTIIVSALIEVVFPTLFIIPIIAIVVCWEHYTRVHFRSFVLEECIIEEIMFKNDLIKNGADPNFPDDPLYVTEEDRASIFEECLYINSEEKFLSKIKNHYRFLISVVAMFIGIYLLIKVLY